MSNTFRHKEKGKFYRGKISKISKFPYRRIKADGGIEIREKAEVMEVMENRKFKEQLKELNDE